MLKNPYPTITPASTHTPWHLAALILCALLITGCAQKTQAPQHNHSRTRLADPILHLPHSDVPHGTTDWKAVRAALGATSKRTGQIASTAGGYGKAVWAGTGGKVIDIAAGRIVNEPPTLISPNGFAWPANGKISRGFRPSSNHKGIDITAPIGEPVYASRAGRVIYASNELSGFGNCIIIQHDPTWTTFYAHNNKNFVQAGDIVQSGQLIAEIGKTGRATGPHLHFEIRCDGQAIDPHPLLP